MKLILITFVATILVASTSVAQVPNYVPTNGLVGWWPFNGNANDESGNGNNGAVNGATLTSDRFGNPSSAFSFNGTSNYIQIPNIQALNDINEMTISVWVKIEGLNTNTNCNLGCAQFLISRGNDSSPSNHFHIRYSQNSDKFVVQDNNGSSPGTDAYPFPFTDYLNLVWVKTATQKLIYINGALESSINVSGVLSSSSQPIFFGYQPNPTYPYYVNGELDDVGIWNRALSSCEIANLYNAQSNSSGSETVTECSSFTWAANNQTYTSTGQYTAVLTNAVGCDSTVTLNLTITEPTTGSETETECSSFTWAANNQTYTSTGQYTAVLTNAVGCDSTVTLNLTITEPTTGSESITECSSFTWGANNQTYTSTGQYTAVLTNAVGCDSTVTLNLTINNVDNGITQVDDFTLEANASGATYQWIDCKDDSPIAGATNQQFIPTENGEYAVIVTQNGCSDTSECLSVVRLSLEENQNQELKVYPNPATSSITISSESNIVGKSFTILNQLGQVVISGEIKHQEMVVDLSHLSAGFYLINISGENQSSFRIVKD